MARLGLARHGWAGFGRVFPRQGQARLGAARHGEAGQGRVWYSQG